VRDVALPPGASVEQLDNQPMTAVSSFKELSLAWYAFFTFLSGFTNSFWQLLMTRGLQGLGFGGEWAVGSVLIGEAIRAQYRGKAVGTVQGGWAIGWGVTAICYTVLFSILPAATAWRARCSGSVFFQRCWCSIFDAKFPSLKFSTKLAKERPLSGGGATF
jgi:MFS family permease